MMIIRVYEIGCSATKIKRILILQSKPLDF